MESRFSQLALETLFPRFCVSCHKEGTLWCKPCDSVWHAGPMYAACPFCKNRGSDRTCLRCASQTYLDGISACAPYGNPVVREALWVWKYSCDRKIEPVIERWLRRGSARMNPPVAAYYVCSVPLHIGKKRSRGFDQARKVAEWAGNQYGLPVEDLLVRVKSTEAQAKRGGSTRQVGELDGIFQIREGVAVPEHVLLCDDVFTSGATMDAAARALKEAGAKSVWGWVIARG